MVFHYMAITAKVSQRFTDLSHVTYTGFHTFDYARHFLSCCSRMLGLEHVTSRGSIMIEYYGRDIGVKIMPTGVNPDRFLEGFSWDDTLWRRGELLTQVCIPRRKSNKLSAATGHRLIYVLVMLTQHEHIQQCFSCND